MWKWRFINEPEEIWYDLLNARYNDLEPWSVFLEDFGPIDFKKCSLWWRDIYPIGADNPLGFGWFWSHLRRKMGEGMGSSFWTHNWSNTSYFNDLFPRLYIVMESWCTFWDWGMEWIDLVLELGLAIWSARLGNRFASSTYKLQQVWKVSVSAI